MKKSTLNAIIIASTLALSTLQTGCAIRLGFGSDANDPPRILDNRPIGHPTIPSDYRLPYSRPFAQNNYIQ